MRTSTVRLLALCAGAGFLTLAFAIRLLTGRVLESADALAQYSGTALYASTVYAGVYVLRPRTAPLTAGVAAIGFCWLIEVFQLTGIPAALSAQSVLARLALGVRFDPTDLAWYPVGVIPLVAAHHFLRRPPAKPTAPRSDTPH